MLGFTFSKKQVFLNCIYLFVYGLCTYNFYNPTFWDRRSRYLLSERFTIFCFGMKQIIKSRQTQLICNNKPKYLLTISPVQSALKESIWLNESGRVKDILVEGQDMSKDSNVREQLVLTSTLWLFGILLNLRR